MHFKNKTQGKMKTYKTEKKNNNITTTFYNSSITISYYVLRDKKIKMIK